MKKPKVKLRPGPVVPSHMRAELGEARMQAIAKQQEFDRKNFDKATKAGYLASKEELLKRLDDKLLAKEGERMAHQAELTKTHMAKKQILTAFGTKDQRVDELVGFGKEKFMALKAKAEETKIEMQAEAMAMEITGLVEETGSAAGNIDLLQKYMTKKEKHVTRAEQKAASVERAKEAAEEEAQNLVRMNSEVIIIFS